MDKAFWDSAVWAEGDDDSENDSFDEKEEEVKPDMFDSDFNDTETDESDEDEEGQLKAQGRREVHTWVMLMLLRLELTIFVCLYDSPAFFSCQERQLQRTSQALKTYRASVSAHLHRAEGEAAQTS